MIKQLLGKCTNCQTTQVFHSQFPSMLHLDQPADSERANSLFHQVRAVSPKIVVAEVQAAEQVLLFNILVGALPTVIDLAAGLWPVLGPSEHTVACTVDDKLAVWKGFMASTAMHCALHVSVQTLFPSL